MAKISAADQKLVDVLLQEHVFSPLELTPILEQHSLISGRLADFLIDAGLLPEITLLRLFERVYSLPMANLAMLETIDRQVVRLLPANLAQLHEAIAFLQQGTQVHVAFLEPPEPDVLQSMKGLAGRDVLVHLAPREVLRWAIATHYPELFLTPAPLASLHNPFENRIGHRLIADGLLTPLQLEEALSERTPGKAGRTGELLLRMGYIGEDDLYRALAAQTDLAFVKMSLEYSIPSDTRWLFSTADVLRWQSIPVFSTDNSITVLTSEPNLLDELQALFDRQVNLMLSTPSQIKHLAQQLESDDEPISRLLVQQGHLRLEQRALALQRAFVNSQAITQTLTDFVSAELIQTIQASLPREQVIPTEQPWELSFSGRLAHSLAAQLGANYVDPNEDPPDFSLKHILSEKIMRQYSLFPYRQQEASLAVLMTDPRNIFALNELEDLLGQPIEPVMADRLEIERLIDQTWQAPPETESTETLIRRLIREELATFRTQLLRDLR